MPADVHTAGLKAAVDEKELPASALAAKKLEAARDAFCGLAKKEAGEMYKRKRVRRKVAKFLAEVGIGAEHQKIVSNEVKKLCEKLAGTVADVLYDEAQAVWETEEFPSFASLHRSALETIKKKGDEMKGDARMPSSRS